MAVPLSKGPAIPGWLGAFTHDMWANSPRARVSPAGGPITLSTLITQLLFDNVEKGFTLAVSFKVVQEEAHGVLQPGGRMVGAVGREQDIFQTVKRMAFRQRFSVEYVQGRTLDSTFGEGADHRGFVDDGTTTDIDYHRVWFHGGEFRLADQPASVRRERRSHDDVVALRDHFEPIGRAEDPVDQRVGVVK